MHNFVMNEYLAKRKERKRFALQKQLWTQYNCSSIITVLYNNPFDKDAMSFPMAYDVALHTLTNT